MHALLSLFLFLFLIFFFSEFGLDTHGSFLDTNALKVTEAETDTRVDETGATKLSSRATPSTIRAPQIQISAPRVVAPATPVRHGTPSSTPLLAPKSPAVAERSPGILAPKSPAVGVGDQMKSPSHADDAEELLRHWENRRHQETLVRCLVVRHFFFGGNNNNTRRNFTTVATNGVNSLFFFAVFFFGLNRKLLSNASQNFLLC